MLIEDWPEMKSEEKLLDKFKHLLHLTPEQDEAQDYSGIKDIIAAIRNLRAENKIEPAKLASVTIISSDKFELIESQSAVIKKLARLENLEVLSIGDKPKESASAVAFGAEIYLELSGLIDVAAEKERLAKELAETEKYLKGVSIKLDNEEFVRNAPEAVVKKEKEKLAEAKEKLEKIKSQLASL